MFKIYNSSILFVFIQLQSFQTFTVKKSYNIKDLITIQNYFDRYGDAELEAFLLRSTALDPRFKKFAMISDEVYDGIRADLRETCIEENLNLDENPLHWWKVPSQTIPDLNV